MIKYIFFLLLSLTSSALLADRVTDYPAEKISLDTYIIHGPVAQPNVINQGFMNNPGFIITKTGVVVIDPGSSVYAGRMVLRQIKKISNKPVTHVFNTHVHGDHWLGNQAIIETYPNAIIMAHPAMIKRAKASEAERWLALLERASDDATKGTEAIFPGRTIEQGFELNTGGKHFKIYSSNNAHSGTDIMIYIPEDSVVFLGDDVMNKRIASMDDASFLGNIKACDTAIKINVRHYVPGHGRSGDINIVKRFKNYLTTIYQQVSIYFEEDLSDFEMKSKIVPRLQAYKDWSDFDLLVGRHISLAYIEVEKSAF